MVVISMYVSTIYPQLHVGPQTYPRHPLNPDSSLLTADYTAATLGLDLLTDQLISTCRTQQKVDGAVIHAIHKQSSTTRFKDPTALLPTAAQVRAAGFTTFRRAVNLRKQLGMGARPQHLPSMGDATHGAAANGDRILLQASTNTGDSGRSSRSERDWGSHEAQQLSGRGGAKATTQPEEWAEGDVFTGEKFDNKNVERQRASSEQGEESVQHEGGRKEVRAEREGRITSGTKEEEDARDDALHGVVALKPEDLEFEGPVNTLKGFFWAHRVAGISSVVFGPRTCAALAFPKVNPRSLNTNPLER